MLHIKIPMHEQGNLHIKHSSFELIQGITIWGDQVNLYAIGVQTRIQSPTVLFNPRAGGKERRTDGLAIMYVRGIVCNTLARSCTNITDGFETVGIPLHCDVQTYRVCPHHVTACALKLSVKLTKLVTGNNNHDA
jgi:hypothetical protein